MKLTGGFLFSFGQLISNIHKQDDYKNKSRGYLNIGTNFPEIHFSNFLSNQTVNSKKTIPRIIYQSLLILQTFYLKMSLRMVIPAANSFASGIDNVKLKKSSGFRGKVILGPMKTLANQPADRLMDNPEKALKIWMVFLSGHVKMINYFREN